MVLSTTVAQQSAPTEETLTRVNQFLDYMWMHPDAKIRYRASDMILNIHSDASYLSAPKAQSHAEGYFILGSIQQDSEPIIINGAINITCIILKHVAAYLPLKLTWNPFSQCIRSLISMTHPQET